MTANARNETFKDLEPVVETVVDMFSRQYHWDEEDARCLAYGLYADAERTWGAERAAFPTWVRQKLWYGLTEEARKQTHRNNILPRTRDPEALDGVAPPPEFDREELVARLAGDARTAVEMVLDVCPDLRMNLMVIAVPDSPTPEELGRAVKAALKKTMKEMGWEAARVNACFRAVRNSL